MQTKVTSRPFAVYDVDGTFFRRSLAVYVVEKLASKGHLGADDFARVREAEESWQRREGAYRTFERTLVEVHEEWLTRGHSHAEFRALAEETIAEHRDKVYVFPRSLLRTVQRLGYATIAISHSMHEAVGAFGRHWNFDHAHGHITGADADGRLDGRALKSNKRELLRELVQEHGYRDTGSIGMGDTPGDIEMVRATNYPIAFNPTAELLDMMLAGPQSLIVTERKNVITVTGYRSSSHVGLDRSFRKTSGERTPFLPLEVANGLHREVEAAGYHLQIL